MNGDGNGSKLCNFVWENNSPRFLLGSNHHACGKKKGHWGKHKCRDRGCKAVR